MSVWQTMTKEQYAAVLRGIQRGTVRLKQGEILYKLKIGEDEVPMYEGETEIIVDPGDFETLDALGVKRK